MADEIDEVLDKLVKNVEAAVHALYRGDTRQETAKARTGGLAREAAEAIRARLAGSVGAPTPPTPAAAPQAAPPGPVGRASAPMTVGAVFGWTRDDGDAVMKCVTAWLPMGAPSSAAPESKCIAAGREMVPTWGERERARAALRKVTAI